MISPAVSWPSVSGNRDAAILQLQALAAPEIVAAFPDMEIGMTYARALTATTTS